MSQAGTRFTEERDKHLQILKRATLAPSFVALRTPNSVMTAWHLSVGVVTQSARNATASKAIERRFGTCQLRYSGRFLTPGFRALDSSVHSVELPENVESLKMSRVHCPRLLTVDISWLSFVPSEWTLTRDG